MNIYFDSRKVTPNSIFVAIKGNNQDGNAFIPDAIRNGATTVVHEGDLEKVPGITYIQVPDSRLALAEMAQNFYGNPSKKLKLLGVTGTNGKTTTATLLYKLFRDTGYKAALLSTIENKINDNTYPATHTTPDPVALAEFLDQAVKAGCTHAFMECSSHAIHQKRTHGLEFAGAIFTNLTHDHLDYHKTVEAYADAKKELFDNLPETAFALANGDDPKSPYMLSGTKARKYFFGMKHPADFFGKIITQSLDGMTISINGKEIQTKLIGKFNAYNILGIFAAAKLLGIEEGKIYNLTPPQGRLEFIKSPAGVYGVVDYAHTPDALKNVLATLHEIQHSKIITVVGCGGDRDTVKRSVMGSIACELSDYVIFTSDNPRSEDPEKILNNITSELTGKNFEIQTDRAKAISAACRRAAPGDIILLAGKGHENYQIFKDKTVHFSDMEELKKSI